MQRTTRLVILFLVFLVSACATPYKSVTQGPVSEVTFSVKDIERNALLFTTSLSYKLHQCNEKEYGSIKLNANNKSSRVNVHANKPLMVTAHYFQNRGSGGTTSGDLSLLFLPKTDTKYFVEYERLGKKFRVLVKEQKGNGSAAVRTKTIYGYRNTNSAYAKLCKVVNKNS